MFRSSSACRMLRWVCWAGEMCKRFVKASRIPASVTQQLWKDGLGQLCQPGSAAAVPRGRCVQQNQSAVGKLLRLPWCNCPWHQPEPCRANRAARERAVLCFALRCVTLHTTLHDAQHQNLCACWRWKQALPGKDVAESQGLQSFL